MKPIIHKQGTETVDVYAGFRTYVVVKAPYCDGAKGLRAGKTYHVTRLWKNLTCKKCLKKRDKLK